GCCARLARANVPWAVTFLFEAEDGIRERNVTGVRTCALPICKRIKDHPDVKKASDATAKASKTVANKSVQIKDTVVDKSANAKNYVIDKKHNIEQKRELKRIAKEHDPAYIEKKGEKLE